MMPSAAMRLRRSPPVVDLFVIVGQSNAEGRGDSALSPAAPSGLYISAGVITSPLADPVGGAATGSMWPALSNEWFAQNGRASAFVEAAKGGSALLLAADTGSGNWSPSGTLRAPAVAGANAAIAALSAAGYTLGVVEFVFLQGEREAQSINGTTITGALYKQGLLELGAYFKAQVPAFTSLSVVRVGSDNPVALASDWLAIRQAQEDACAESGDLRMAYRGLASFPAAGLQPSGVHYSQAGYNLAGKCVARELSNATQTPPLAAPAVLATQSWADTDWTVNSSLMKAHVTAAGTKAIVVAVPMIRGGTVGSGGAGSCSFNGVAMLAAATNRISGGAGLTGATVALFYLSEADYGSALGGVSANIVYTPDQTQSILNMAAIDLDAEVILDFATTSIAASGNSLAGNITTNANVFVVGAACAGILSATFPTAVIAGMTEILDNGGIRPGNDRSGMGCVGYALAGEAASTSFGVTFSSSIACAAHAVAAFRAKIDGE